MQQNDQNGQGNGAGVNGRAALRRIGTPAAASPDLPPRAAGGADANEGGAAQMELIEREPIRRGGRSRRHPAAAATPAAEYPISVVVADANFVLRTAARAVLAASGEFKVYEATNFEELSAVVAAKRPSIALVDFDLPPAGGLNTVAALTERYALRVVVWGFSPKPESVLTVVWAHAYGFLPKAVTPDALVRSLRGVADGEACLSREMTSELIGELHSFARRERSRRLAATLSTREWEVMGLVSSGFTNKQIASALYISEFTVKRHIHNILAKLGARSRRAAAAAFRDAQAAEKVLEALETA
jgi:DNA-binding NarL/FixJ family response regulator